MEMEKVGGLLVPVKDGARLYGRYHGTLIRNGVIIEDWIDKNVVVNQGLNDWLSVYLAAGSQKTTWYLGLFSGNYTPLSTDTAANIASNSSESSAYSGGVRQTWSPGCGLWAVGGQFVLSRDVHVQRHDHDLWRVPDLEQHDQRHERHAVLRRAIRFAQGGDERGSAAHNL